MMLLRSLAFQTALYLFTAVMAVAGLPMLLAPRRLASRFGCGWAAAVLKICAWTVGLTHELRGAENLPKGPALIAMKHQSAWDTFAVAAIFDDPAIVLKQELIWVPFYGWYLWKAGMISVDRKGGAAALRRLVAAGERAVTAGRPIVIFPEGTRTAPGTRRPYHPGVAALYRQLGVPLVPVAVDSGLYWGRRHFLKRPGRIVVEILPPIPPGGDRRSVMAQLQERIEGATERLVAEARRAMAVDKSVDRNRSCA